MSNTCISLSGSTQCPAWNASSISTNSDLTAQFPFMRDVSNLTQFDQALSDYVHGDYVKGKYTNGLGCHGVNLTNTDDYYARYTTSVICNGLVQSSTDDCSLSEKDSRPLCADTCALMAMSEEEIAVNSDLCSNPKNNYIDQIRSDATVCTLPTDVFSGSCIEGVDNEPDNCGFGPNLLGLCGYCRSSSPNSTDSCCTNSKAETRCADVTLPTTTVTLPPILPSSSSNSTAGAGADDGLSGGQIAGIVIGSVAGVALIAILIALIFLLRRRRRAQNDSALNQPNPQRKGSPSIHYAQSEQGHGLSPVAPVAPVGRVARMSALREVVSSSPGRSRDSTGIFGEAKYSDHSDSDGFGASPGAMSKRIPPITGKRNGSLSSSSVFAGVDSDTSPNSGTAGQYSSPGGMTSGQSEQLSSFHDYYSQDDIHPGDKVSVLWAYQPRAGDEFQLDRGEMLKVIGIWDDGWATGVRLSEGAEEFDDRHREQRDSGVSNGSQRLPSPPPSGDIKAFPLVCVCSPQHWSKIIDGAGQHDGEESDEGTG